MPGNEFELEVTENPPTEEQLTTIFDYLGPEAAIPGKPSDLVKEARNQEDAIKKVLENGNSFIRPVIVDWDNGKAVYGGNEPAIIKMLKELPQ
ncbi:hypothetical protein KEM55_006930 [Ascosphaera atra]|nr:hypothetical protein KEM55_006930 [Ascosphaera atra]